MMDLPPSSSHLLFDNEQSAIVVLADTYFIVVKEPFSSPGIFRVVEGSCCLESVYKCPAFVVLLMRPAVDGEKKNST